MALDAGHGVADIGFDAVGVNNEDSLGVGGIARRVIGFHRADGLRSMNSIAAGTMPSPMMAATQAPASGTASKLASMVRVTGAFLRILTVASTTMPSKPSEPVIRPRRSRPPAPGALPPRLMISPPGSDEFDAQQIVGGQAIFQAMQSAAEFSATLPPMVQAIWLEGSGA